MGYNLLINEVYWGYNPFTNLLLASWDILVPQNGWFIMENPIFYWMIRGENPLFLGNTLHILGIDQLPMGFSVYGMG